MTGDGGFTSSADKLVLIVDDDQDLSDMLAHVIKKEGFKLETCADGGEAQAKARALSPDIILLDLMLPKVGGFEILRALQGDETSEIPVIVMTGRQMDRSTAEMIRQQPNVREFVEKPLKTGLLVSYIHRILKTHPPK